MWNDVAVWQICLALLVTYIPVAKSATTLNDTATPQHRTLGIPVREGDIPPEAMRFIELYKNTWPPPLDCCSNGGTCVHLENGTTTCICPPNFTGEHCEDDVNECRTQRPCGRFSICTNLYGSFRCSCMPGFEQEGALCLRIVTCEESPCLNGATCVTRRDISDVCYCKIGFAGRFCERAIPECRPGACPRGTFCVSTRRGFQCLHSFAGFLPAYKERMMRAFLQERTPH
ncbi:delta-like protein 1 [Ornithodoros turicata]|uniref:delta-like protein 1 n=1 Tax=Ornithodoros turicata TaxID=34597 RepID=UPI00313931DA